MYYQHSQFIQGIKCNVLHHWKVQIIENKTHHCFSGRNIFKKQTQKIAFFKIKCTCFGRKKISFTLRHFLLQMLFFGCIFALWHTFPVIFIFHTLFKNPYCHEIYLFFVLVCICLAKENIFFFILQHKNNKKKKKKEN